MSDAQADMGDMISVQGASRLMGGATAQPSPASSQAEGGDCPCPESSSQKEETQPFPY